MSPAADLSHIHPNPRFEFDGGAGTFLVVGFLGFLVTLLTLGLCFPWAIVMKERWRVEHTLVGGKRMKFHGSAWGLFGLWIRQWFLLIITFGIYIFWLIPSIESWKAKNTSF